MKATTVPPGYRIISTLAAGRQCAVFKAERRADGSRVILKSLNTADLPASSVAAFRREFAVAHRIQHPGVCDVVDLVALADSLIIVIKDIGGTALDQLGRGRPMEVADFLDLAAVLVDAVAAIHGAGIVHKNITPANIVWNPATRCVNLIDFGIASELLQEETTAGSVDTIEGTLAFIAPEQTGRMNRSIDYRADFYALGATFHQLLTGQPPFAATDPLELVHCHLARTPAPVHRINAAVPEMLSAIVAHLMAKDPEDRYQSAFGLKADLDRCRADWRTQGAISPFLAGERDRRSVLHMPRRLYGRETQQDRLIETFEKVAKGSHGVMMVSGFSGIGKSSLVNELQGPVTLHRGFFVAGKFDLLRRDDPYAPFLHAFDELAARIVASGEETADWAFRIRQALGDEAAVLTGIMPDLERLIGAQPPVPITEPTEAQNRLFYAFRRLVGAFGETSRPLVLFLDDLQWADLSSLKLMAALAGDRGLGHFLLIGAFRSNEVDAAHPLGNTIETIEANGTAVETLVLEGLAETAVGRLLADTLAAEARWLQPLTSLLWSKSFGNPFFLGQLLAEFERLKLLAFDHVSGSWWWDVAGIEQCDIADDLAELMVKRLRELPEDTVDMLGTASCIGSEFALSLVASVASRAPAETARLLWPVLQAGLIVPIGEAYRYADDPEMADKVAYRFVHDRVEQAAYSLRTETEKCALHLAIGLAMQASAGSDDKKKLFDVVHQLNRAASILSPEDRLALAQMNLRAGRQARSAAAFGPALRFFEAGLALLPDDAWDKAYELALALHLDAAELAVWAEAFDTAIVRIDTVLAHCSGVLEQARALDILIELRVAQHALQEGLAVGRRAAALLGWPFPKRLRIRHSLWELLQTKIALIGKADDDLVSAAPANNPRVTQYYRSLSALAYATYRAEPSLMVVGPCRMVRLYLKYGRLPKSDYAFAGLAMSHVVMGDFNGATRFARVAIRLADQTSSCFALYIYKVFIESWHRPMREVVAGIADLHYLANARGDFQTAEACMVMVARGRLFCGAPLDAAMKELVGYKASGTRKAQQALASYHQMMSILIGETPFSGRFDGPYFREDTDIHQLRKDGDGTRVAYICSGFAHLCLLFGHLDRAWEFAEMHRAFKQIAWGMQTELRGTVLCAVVRFAHWDHLDAKERRRVDREARTTLRRLAKTERFGSANMSHLVALLSAERHRAFGRIAKAERRYQRAAAIAKAQGFHHDEGLAALRAADLAATKGQGALAEVLLRRAATAFEQWGAKALVEQLATRLAESSGLARPAHAMATGGMATHTLDISTVVRASHALAEKIRLADLLASMMHLVIANAGATKGHLLLESGGGWRIEATATSDKEAVQVLKSLAPDGAEHAALRHAVAEVERTGKLSLGGYDGGDLVAPRSLLCLPLMTRSRLTGILYLENDLADGVFNAERVELLNLLSTQIAISIENARLYDGLEAQVVERTQELAAARQAAELAAQAKADFLANMSHEIRTPMNAIVGFAHLVGKTELDAHQQEYLAQIQLSAKHLLGIINNILDFSKIEAGKLTVESIDAHLDEILQSVGTLISGKAAAKGLDLVFDVADDVPIDVRGDPWRLVQILANYANNAVKFTETGEVAILVRLVEDDGDSIVLRFAVRDTGIGLTGDQKRMLFRSFSQADSSTTRKYGGSGLGLAISKRLAQLMGGAVGVDSELGKGSTFWFTAKLGKGSPRPSLDVRPELRAKRVLVVEDNDNARTMLARMLSDMTFHVEVADSGDAALAAIEAANLAGAAIELVLFDCRMPDMAGLETAARMRTTFAESCPRLVMVAPYAHESMVTRADPIGIDGILIKPVTASSLFDCIMRVFGDSRAERTRRAKSSDMPADDVISALRGAKILLAEDNHLNQRVACEMLQGVGLEVEVAENGAIAVAMAQSARFDLILMDMQMPVLDGVTATREIRNLAVPTPIVAMTANAFQSDRDTCIAAGMNDYLAKPINPTALVAVLAKWVKRGGATPPAEAYPAQSLDSATLRMVSSRLGMFLYDRSDQARDVWSSNANLLKAAFPAHFEEIDRAIGEGDYERALTLLDRALAPPRPPGLPDIDPAVFDFDRIGPIYGWDVEALHDALDGFVDDADGKRAAIETALAGGQVERTREVAHALKGIAGVTGATRLAKSASQLEIAARTGRIDDANRLAPEIGPAVAELREALDRFFSCRADGETECLKRTSGN